MREYKRRKGFHDLSPRERLKEREKQRAKQKQEEREQMVQARRSESRMQGNTMKNRYNGEKWSQVERKSPTPVIPQYAPQEKEAVQEPAESSQTTHTEVDREEKYAGMDDGSSAGIGTAELQESELAKQDAEDKTEKKELKKKRKKAQRKKMFFLLFTNFGCLGSLLGLLLSLGVLLIILGGVVAIIASEEGGDKQTAEEPKTTETTGGTTTGGEQPKVENVGDPSSYGYHIPVKGTPRVTSPYGARWGTIHKGIDFACKEGVDPILAAKKGKVGWAKFGQPGSGFGGYGNVAVLEHEGGQWTLYGHMNKLSVQEGQEVEAGTQLGICGATGQVTGPHLHFEIKTSFKFGQIDPTSYLPK
ncbi:M23 family metallopeptidase [Bacillus cereus]|uniref:M23 family metallopeptidase n=1 Tax=Bacillus cereus TaxID=1396 RepID=UPI00211ED5A2|nr:M23 family metallopeptidase [Bacillus cereus]